MSALVIGILGAFFELINVVFFHDEVNVFISVVSIITCVAIVVAYYKKIPYLYLPFIVFNVGLIELFNL